ncbi:MAG: nuclear transport factor 2 family protein [Acidimicrobiales bacterium]|jgi:ketosteroid isomerase-like protein
MTTTSEDQSTVLAANQRFYDALEARDMAAMSAVWEQTDDVICVHPGWTILRGWVNVAGSWDRILNGPGHNQFILTNTSVRVEGDTAWVVLDENLMTDGHAGTIACTNVFRRDGDDWRMVVHHGSPVMSG